MIIYVPDWLEFSYLQLFENKNILYNNYEEFLEEEEIIFIKDMKEKEYKNYLDSEKMIILANSNNQPYIKNIDCNFIVKELCKKFDYPYHKKITTYCEKNEICPFITVLNLSLGGNIPVKNEPKELIPDGNIISVSKYLQSHLWFYFLSKKNSNFYGEYSRNKCLYFYEYFIEMEKEFAYIDNELSHIYYLPFQYFK
jgi:hypothetical protein